MAGTAFNRESPRGGQVREETNGMEWLTTTEAAKHLKCKPRSLLLWVRQGKIKGFRLSGTKRVTWRFRRQDLDAALLESPADVLSSPTPTVLSSPAKAGRERRLI